MISTGISPAPSSPAPSVDAIRWQTYDESGWAKFESFCFEEARHYFVKALEIAALFPQNAMWRGRSLGGLAWAEYRIAEQVKEVGGNPEEIAILFQAACRYARDSVDILAKSNLDERVQVFLARAQHVLGLIHVQLCDGSTADSCLSAAETIYRALGQLHLSSDILHVRAKLMQCSRSFRKAISLLQQTVNEAEKTERKFAALVDLVNTLTWTGYIREALQLEVTWKMWLVELEHLPEYQRPVDALLRGRLVFARAHMLFGNFDRAHAILTDAHERLCQCSDISTICRAVFWIVSAELELAEGHLHAVREALGQFHRVVHDKKLSGGGYACLEVVAIDAACQICVIETCTYEVFKKVCCYDRCCCRVVFVPTVIQQTTTKWQPIDFGMILAAIVNGLQALLEFHCGRFTAAEALLQASVCEIEIHLHKQSPLLISLIQLRAEVSQARKQSPIQVRSLLEDAHRLAMAIGASLQPVNAERDRILANWHVQLSEYAPAADLYSQSLKHGMSFRSGRHPQQLFVKIAYLENQALAAVGEKGAREKLQLAAENIWPELALLSEQLDCHDYRIGLSIVRPAWLCMLLGRIAPAQRGFHRSVRFWFERLAALACETHDPRTADAMLGDILTSIEQGAELKDVEPQFQHLCAIATREISSYMLSFELNRVGMLVMRAYLLRAAEYCFYKAIELFPSQAYPRFRPTAHDNLKILALLKAEVLASTKRSELPRVAVEVIPPPPAPNDENGLDGTSVETLPQPAANT